jgi:ribosomal protein L19E
MSNEETYILNLESYPLLYEVIHASDPSPKLIITLKAYYSVKTNHSCFYDKYSLFNILCLYGKEKCIESIGLTPDKLKEALEESNYLSIRLASQNGHIMTVQYLERFLTDSEIKQTVKAKGYRIIQFPACNGDVELIQHFESYLTTYEKKEAVKANRYQNFKYAIQSGNINTLKHFESHLTEIEKAEAVKANGYLAFEYAVQSGNINTLKYLGSHLTEIEKAEAAKANGYLVFEYAVQSGNLNVIKYLGTHLTEAEKKEAAKSACFQPIKLAAENGDIKMIEYFLSYFNEEEIKKLVKSEHYEIFIRSARLGKIEIIHYFECYLSEVEKTALVKNKDYKIIREAAVFNQIEVIKHFNQYLKEDEKKEVFQSRNCSVFREILRSGKVVNIKGFLPYVTEAQKKEAIKFDNYDVIIEPLLNGQRETVLYLMVDLTEVDRKEVVNVIFYNAVLYGAEIDETERIKYFETYLTESEKKEAVTRHDYEAFRLAVKNNSIHTMIHFENYLTTHEKKEVVTAKNYSLVSNAITGKSIEVYKRLEIYLTGSEKKALFTAQNSAVIRRLISYGKIDMLKYLLSSMPMVLSYLEMHDHEYGNRYVYPFVAESIASLKQRETEFEKDNPDVVFDIEDVTQVEICFYMIRNLIRRGAENNQLFLLKDIRFLLSIPSVRALAHERVNQGEPNELERLASTIGNYRALAILIQLPEVKHQSSQNNFFQAEAQGELNLSRLPTNTELSMGYLSNFERKAVENIKSYYKIQIDAMGGFNIVLEGLKSALKSRYELHPAVITLQTEGEDVCEEIVLPFEWSELQILRAKLTNAQYDDALKAYYKHTNHTVYRYFSKPNYWMAANAIYVYEYKEDGHRTAYRYSSFEDHLDIIIPFYLAVTDKNPEHINGFSLDSRMNFFIKELALMGRAHNWEKSRSIEVEAPKYNTYSRENPVYLLHNKGKIINEEYDDLEGDKPSCHSGVDRRLFQSLFGHPLFNSLNSSIVIQPLNEIVREYYQSVISADMSRQLKAAYKALSMHSFDHISKQEAEAILKSVDIPCELKTSMISDVLNQLSKSYSETSIVFSPTFRGVMEQYFKMALTLGGDFIYFYTMSGLEEIIEEKESKLTKAPSSLLVNQGMFGMSAPYLQETRAASSQSEMTEQEEGDKFSSFLTNFYIYD